MRRILHIGILVLTTAALATPFAAANGGGATKLDGRWRWSWSRADLLRVGVPPANVKLLTGPGMIEFRGGRLFKLDPRTGRVEFLAGSYTAAGVVATFVFRRIPGLRPPPGIVPGTRYQLKWSIYRDRLTWSQFPGRESLLAFTAVPWTRVR